jgi:hypothetical protein
MMPGYPVAVFIEVLQGELCPMLAICLNCLEGRHGGIAPRVSYRHLPLQNPPQPIMHPGKCGCSCHFEAELAAAKAAI